MILKSISFPFTVPNCTSNGEIDFSQAAYSLKSERTGLLILLNCEASIPTVFTTMCSNEQQTSDNLIVKDNCFIIEIFGKFSFSGIFRGCLSL